MQKKFAGTNDMQIGHIKRVQISKKSRSEGGREGLTFKHSHEEKKFETSYFKLFHMH